MDARNELISWLRDAYAMERGLETTLKKFSQNDKYPEEFRAACRKHLLETQQQSQTVESLLKSLGADKSTVKTGIGLLMETIKGAGAVAARDQVVKEMITTYASEQFEIACYEAIVAAAEVAGQPLVAEACRQMISDEKNMAQTIYDLLPGAVHFYLGEQQLPKAA